MDSRGEWHVDYFRIHKHGDVDSEKQRDGTVVALEGMSMLHELLKPDDLDTPG